ncbi:MAG: hypothetical protein LH472_11100 [Pyrinomonadaceae bacterium]|nr:hypothetical protein [Pyrinomonadaceae bacterium]
MDQTAMFVVAAASIVLSIFGSAWLNQRSSERLIESLRGELKAEFLAVRAEMKTLETKIDALDSRVSRIERQLEQLFAPMLK